MSNQADAPFFEAVLVPHRSLSRRGLRLLIAAICMICGINAAVFIRLGAWPVAGFTGVELLLAAVLLHINARAVRGSEMLLLSPSGVRILRTEPNGRRRETVIDTAWLNVVLEERPGRVPGLLLISRDRREEVGRSLGEEEKRDLARALSAALHGWRYPRFDNPQLAE